MKPLRSPHDPHANRALIFKNRLAQKRWYLFKWEPGIIVLLGFMMALLNMIPSWVNATQAPIYFDNGDKYVPNLLRDNFWYSFIALHLMILMAVFIGIYTQLRQYVGKYSAALFALVPALVWVLTTRSDNHIEHIMFISSWFSKVLFYLVLATVLLFIVSLLLTIIFVQLARSYRHKMKWEMSHNFVTRICVININVAMIFLLSVGLINFGMFALHLGNIPLVEQNAIFAASGIHPGSYNLHSDQFTTYIAMIALLFAVLMVLVGLAQIWASPRGTFWNRDDHLKHQNKQGTSQADNRLLFTLNNTQEQGAKMEESKNYVQQITHHIAVDRQRRNLTNGSFLIIFFSPIIAIVTLFVIFISGNTMPGQWGSWLLFVFFIPIIMVAVFWGQKQKVTGIYGETILLLIPTFVWLLPGHELAIKWMVSVAFGLALIGILAYLVVWYKSYRPSANREHNLRITSLFLRIAFIASTVVSTIVIALILIFWGEAGLQIPVDKGVINYQSTGWILYIALVTVAIALVLVILGLVGNLRVFQKNWASSKNKKSKNIRLKQTFLATTITSTKKRSWQRKTPEQE